MNNDTRDTRDNRDIVDDDGVVAMTALEHRAGVDSLDELQAKRRALVKQIAPLAAKFRSGTVANADALRKRHRALVAKRILMTEFANRAAPSEAALERMANADTEHISFCEKLEQEFIRYVLLENDIADITEAVRNREEMLRCWRAEIGLERS